MVKQGGIFQCEICNLGFSHQAVMTAHMTGSKHQRKVQGKELLYKLQKTENCFTHDEETGKLICLVCQIELTSPQLLEAHLKGSKHKIRVNSPTPADLSLTQEGAKQPEDDIEQSSAMECNLFPDFEKHLCESSQTSCNYDAQLDQHISSEKHYVPPMEMNEGERADTDIIPESPDKCCNFEKIILLSQNIESVINMGAMASNIDKGYHCNHCNKYFTHKDDRDKHLETPYQCGQCESAFKEIYQLKAHWLTHTVDKPYRCRQCNKAYSKRKHLYRHMRKHPGEDPYQCNHCDKAFSHLIYFRAHLRSHIEEYPYQCNHCDEAFRNKGELDIHMMSHKGDKPYQCTYCNKTFTKNKSRNKHLRKHNEATPYPCNAVSAQWRGFASGVGGDINREDL